MARLSGKKALITGGSRGIGRATALRFAAEGADIALTYSSSPDAAKDVVAAIEKMGRRAVAFQADARHPKQLSGLIGRVVEALGGLDILMNNAGVFMGSPITDTTDEEFETTFAVNVHSVFMLGREAARALPEGGRIINVGSILGERSLFEGMTSYAMSKFAVAGMTRAWARDLAPRQITVNCIQPGPIATDMNHEEGDMADVMRSQTALKRYGRAEEIAALAAFLASPEAAYITGTVQTIDGGWLA